MNYKNWSLKQKNVGIFSFLIFVVFLSGAVIFGALSKSKEVTDITNVLGRQRMLSQAMGKSALGTAMAKSRKKTIEQQVSSLDRYISLMRLVYTKDVIPAVKKANIKISSDPESENQPSVPFPATLTRLINEKFGSGREFSIDIISDNPVNPNKGLKTELDKEAFSYIKKNPTEIFSRTYEDNGKLYMGLYTADVATADACASCHTALKGKAYKVGDIFGMRSYNLLFSEDIALGNAELQAGLTEYEMAKKMFAQTLAAVKDGGEYFLDLAGKETRTASPITDEITRSKIADVEVKFKELMLHVTSLLKAEVNSTPYRVAQQNIITVSNDLRKASDTLVDFYAKEANRNQQKIRWTVILSSLITLAILLSVMYYMSAFIIRPITQLSQVLGEMAKGNFKQQSKLYTDSYDEIGSLSETYNVLLDTMQDIVKQAEDIAAGNLTNQYDLEGDLSVAFKKMTQELIEKQKADQKFKEMAEERRVQADDLQKKVDHLLQVVSYAARGDLTRKVLVTGKDAIGQMGSGLIVFFKKLTESISAILQASNILARSATEISGAIQDQAAVTAQQAASVTEISATVEELSSSSSEVAVAATNVAEFSSSALHESERGVEALENLKTKMDEITEDNNVNIKEIVDLGKKSNEIGKVMEIINNIADQTKLIAFNAAIEAASAGEAGKRFSVVAVEIRRLADSVMESTGDIAGKIEEIQQSVNRLVITSEKGSKKIQEGTQLTGQTISDLNKLVSGAKATADAATQISLSTSQQKVATDQVLLALKEIVKGSRQTSNAIKQTSTVTGKLSEMSNDLKLMLSKFNIDTTLAGQGKGQ